MKMIRSHITSHAIACVKKMTFLWALLALVFHVVPGAIVPTHAQGTRKDDIVFNSRGIPLAGATVRVCAMPASGQPCTPLALIYSDAALTQALANPTATDGLGNYFFYAAPGKYEIEISGPSITTKQIPNIILPNDPSSPNFSAVSAFSLTLSGNLTVSGNTTVIGNLASGTLNVTNQSTPPGTPASGTVNLYTKTADKRLYYKDDTGTELGPLGPGAQTNVVNTFTAAQNFDNDLHFKGPSPWLDVTRYGARPVVSTVTPASTGITGGISSGTNSLTVSTSSCPGQANSVCFQNGDGIVVYGAGAAHTMTTPGAPSVATALPQAPPTEAHQNAAGLTGSTTYNYQIIARNAAGGLTASSPVGSITTGPSSLGTQSVNLTSCSRANAVVTCITSSAHGLVVGALVRLSGLSDGSFVGWFNAATVPDTTHFTINTALDSTLGATTSATGGTVTWWNANHLTWSAVSNCGTPCWYYVYGRSGGSLTLIGVSQAQTPGLTDLSWDDYGSPMMDNVQLPAFVPNTPPASATSNNLSTAITSGAGTTTLTLAANAGTTVAGATVRYDVVPNLVTAAAAAASAGPLYFPNTTVAGGSYVVNSYLDLSPYTLTISQSGGIVANDTINLASGLHWYGDRIPLGSAAAQFGFQGNAPISCLTANPCILQQASNSTVFQSLTLQLAGNAGRGYVTDGGNQLTMNDIAFVSNGGNNDYMTVGFYSRSNAVASNSFGLHFNRILLFGGSQTSQTLMPMFICDRCGTTEIKTTQASGHGTFLWIPSESGGLVVTHNYGYIQGGVTPFYMVAPRGGGGGTAAGNFQMSQITLDTTNNSTFATLVQNSPTLTAFAPVWFPPTGAGGPIITGLPLSGISDAGAGISGQNFNYVQSTGTGFVAAGNKVPNTGLGPLATGFQVLGTGGMGYAFPTPAAPTVVVGAHNSCSSNCVAAGTYYYYISANDANGGFSLSSPASAAATTDGTQTITVSWTLLNGQVSTNTGRYTASNGGLFTFNWGGGVPGTSYSDSSGTSYSVSSPPLNTGFSAGLSGKGVAAQQAILVDPASSFASTMKPATLSANRSQTLPDATGYVPVTSYINSAYDNATRSNGAIGSSWTVTNNGINISSNNFVGTSSSNDVAYWSANPFSPVQFSQVTLTSLNGTTDFPGVAVLLSGSGASTHGYECVEDTTNIFIQKITGTSNSTLTSASTTGAAGDLLRLEVDGAGNLTCFKNGVSALTVNDTSYISGAPGLFLFGTVATSKNWSGGNLHPLGQLDSEQDWTKTQHFTQGIALGAVASESFNNNPRSEQSVFLPGALTSTWTASTWTLDRPVAITRVQVQAKTAPSGCSTNAVVRLTDGTNPVNVTISAAANDSGSISQNYAAGSSLTVAVQTAASGCATSPADANVVVQYRMQ